MLPKFQAVLNKVLSHFNATSFIKKLNKQITGTNVNGE